MTLAPVYFTVAGRYRSVVADAATDSNADPEIGAVSATVTFQPLISAGDVILASQAAPRPTGFLAAPIVALIDPTDGLLKLRTTQDTGASGGLGYVPVRLLADTDVLELNGPLYYEVTFTDVVYNNGARGAINSFTFQAPNADLELDLITVATGPSQVAAGLTKVAPTGVRYDPAGFIVFTVSGVDIPDPVPIAALTGPTGASGASGGTGGTGGVGPTGAQGSSGIPGASGIPGVSGIPGEVGATGATGAMGASGASGGTGGTGLAGQSVSLKGSVASYSLLPGSATNGDGYILLTDNLLYVWNGSWPAEGSGVPFVGPQGASGASGASGLQGASGVAGEIGATGASGAQGASGGTGGTGGLGPTGPAGATGASGASGGTGGTGAIGASGVGALRSIATTTVPVTLGNTAGTDYVVFADMPAGDANYSSVVALLKGDGADASTTITDSSPLAANWTAFGDAKLSTAEKKYGTASIAFDGTGDYIESTAAGSNFALPGDFTIEFWMKTATTSGNRQTILDFGGATDLLRVDFINQNVNIGYTTGGVMPTLIGTGNTGATYQTWHHLAFSRSGTTLKVFLNGTELSSITNSTAWAAPTAVRVGATAAGDNFFNGYLDDIRITRTARYASSFTAPTATFLDKYAPEVTLPTAVSNTNEYLVQNINAVTATVKTTSAQTINGSSTHTIASGATARYLSNGTNWRIV